MIAFASFGMLSGGYEVRSVRLLVLSGVMGVV